MSDLQKLARDSSMLNGTTPYLNTGSSRYDEGLRKQYFADQTRLYADEIGDVASNVYDAQCQGIGGTDWYDWTPVQIRVSPAAIASTGETMPDDWQKLHILKPVGIDTVPIGAYLTFAGNTWIVYKGRNMGSVLGDGIIRRCNSVINVLDYYGNIVSVPMSYAKMATLGNASHATENSIVAKNYISCICQLNQYSAAFAENTRIILGKTAYSLRGLNDFTREFTDDQNSVHLLTFTIERSAPLPQDRLDLQCADYDSFRWELSINGRHNMARATQQVLHVSSIRNGVPVVGTEEHPITYSYRVEKSDPRFLVTVTKNTSDENATVKILNLAGVGAQGRIIATLDQNPEIEQSWEIIVVSNSAGRQVTFGDTVPETLRVFESALIRVMCEENGQSPAAPAPTVTFSGPPVSCYTAARRQDIDIFTYEITCYAPSNIPLTITGTDPQGGESATAQIILADG